MKLLVQGLIGCKQDRWEKLQRRENMLNVEYPKIVRFTGNNPVMW